MFYVSSLLYQAAYFLFGAVAFVQWLKLPAWEVGDHGIHPPPRSGIQSFKDTNVFFPLTRESCCLFPITLFCYNAAYFPSHCSAYLPATLLCSLFAVLLFCYQPCCLFPISFSCYYAASFTSHYFVSILHIFRSIIMLPCCLFPVSLFSYQAVYFVNIIKFILNIIVRGSCFFEQLRMARAHNNLLAGSVYSTTLLSTGLACDRRICI